MAAPEPVIAPPPHTAAAHGSVHELPGTARATALLVVVTVVWGTTFPLVKDLTAHLGATEIVSSRFGLAALVLSPWLRSGGPLVRRHGAVLGVLLFGSFATQTIGLRHVAAGRAAFITGLNVVLVPLALPLLGRALPRRVLGAALIACVGLALLSWERGTLRFSAGDVWVGACAVLYAAYVLGLERYATLHDALALSAMQVTTVAVCGAASTLLLRIAGHTAPVGAALGMREWAELVYLGIIAVALTTLLQTTAQRSVTAAVAAVVYALEPVFGAVASRFWSGERIGTVAACGAALIVLATIIGQDGAVRMPARLWRRVAATAGGATRPRRPDSRPHEDTLR